MSAPVVPSARSVFLHDGEAIEFMFSHIDSLRQYVIYRKGGQPLVGAGSDERSVS